MLPDTTLAPARYLDAEGRDHAVAAEPDPDGGWRVVDRGPHDTRLVERLTGYDDGPDQAAALAADYRREIRAHLAGRRRHHPCPPPAHRAPWPDPRPGSATGEAQR